MIWHETISIRTAADIETRRVFEVGGKIRIPQMSGGSANSKVYGSNSSTELNTHIQWISQSELEGKNPLGRALSRTFTDLGLVSNTRRVQTDQSQSIETTR